jgi:CRISPR-associated protein Cmr2
MVNNLTNTLHFTFGPVQEFVSQARKTRDLWAGSYLLSYLAGKAMVALIQKGGKITFPAIDGDLLIELIQDPGKWGALGRATMIGSLPNRFAAKVPDDVNGQVCSDAIQTAWKEIANAVCATLNKNKIVINDETWDRQINNLWECQWVLGERDDLLDRRKNMRCHLPPPEPGEKCTMCGVRKELSDLPPGPLVIKKINDWWKKSTKGETISDFNEGERLCAVCITKRLFPAVNKWADGAKTEEKILGWPVSKYFPSTSFMAAVDWLDDLLKASVNNDALAACVNKFVEVVRDNVIEFSTEYRTMIPSLEKTAKKAGVTSDIIWFDGNLFHQFTISDDALNFKNKTTSPEKIRNALAAIQTEMKKMDRRKFEATPFYALLLMDGDGMGKLIAGKSEEQRNAISSAIAEFTRQVPEIVSGRNGWLIYAGGDDVFALLPVDQALDCAACCQAVYQSAFCRKAPFVSKAQATISAAIEYAHMKTPLGPLVRDAHRLLDNIAKDKTGRDAVACRVWKRGGPILTWAQPWQTVITADGTIVGDVRKAFQNDSGDPDKFSSKFFYKLRDLFAFINEGTRFSETDIRDLLTVEYLATREHVWDDNLSKKDIVKIASHRVAHIMSLCQKNHREITENSGGGPIAAIRKEKHYIVDGALLVRFLSQKEV